MKRFTVVLIAAGALWGAVSALAAPRAREARGAKVALRQTHLGKLLVNGRGFTLYAFQRDHRGRDVCVSISGCVGLWPVLRTSGRPIAGPGVERSLLGTIRLSSGARQVTYAGHPLYTYVGDVSPASTSYVGIDQSGGRWFALNGRGKVVR